MKQGTELNAGSGIDLNSWHFLLIAAAAVVVFRVLARGRVRAPLLLLFNCYFLMAFIRAYDALLLLGGLLLFTYAAAELRRRLGERLPAGVCVAIVLLFWAFLFCVKDPGLAGPFNPFHRHPIYLIGISYIVFRCIHYFMDVEVLDDREPLTFVNFMLFFPTLIAGPIERYERFRNFQEGAEPPPQESPLPALHRIVNGLIKKFVLADNLYVFGLMAKPADETWSVPMLWLGMLLLPVLLYLDFSGYCDVMIGLARLMGFQMAENFDRPWRARDIQDFWNRWHITLSHFIRDYVYNPINRVIVTAAPRRWQFVLLLGAYMLTMLLIALWHATSWGFLVFGLVHGLALIALQVGRRYFSLRLPQQSGPVVVLAWAGMYCFISASMVFWHSGVRGAFAVFCALVGA